MCIVGKSRTQATDLLVSLPPLLTVCMHTQDAFTKKKTSAHRYQEKGKLGGLDIKQVKGDNKRTSFVVLSKPPFMSIRTMAKETGVRHEIRMGEY